jgi:hypothetical protein
MISGQINHFGSGAPSGSATRGTLYQDTSTGDVYVNTDGSTTWVKQIGQGVQVVNETSNQEVGNTTTETTIFSKSIPGDTIGASGLLKLDAIIDLKEDAAEPTVTFRLKFGGTTIATISGVAAGAGTRLPIILRALLANKGATNSQLGQLIVNGSVDDGTASQDSTAAKDLVLTAQWSALPTTADGIRLKYASVSVIK